ncbi:hypothetical protein Rhopal_001031-T1 [Rhodotorula paludigena]|uniref:TMEM205-like domain-containing protein n=1 Tax=Rhodotorula paludigena TaxID=86838 RepID=A0AAV5GE93_9BASI|nr:hypothetical protein Rhopal_001031-T1 [Rhodotorula paludigena]
MSDASVTPSVFRALADQRGLYNILLGTTLGTTVWHSFIGGPVAYKALPRQQFGHLQSKLFPKFFSLQSVASLALAALYGRSRTVSWTRFWRTGDRNAWALVFMVATGFANWWFVGPLTTNTMKRRHRLERLEGKEYSDDKASPEMKQLNRRFGLLHGVSSLLNLVFLSAAASHAAYIAAFSPV